MQVGVFRRGFVQEVGRRQRLGNMGRINVTDWGQSIEGQKRKSSRRFRSVMAERFTREKGRKMLKHKEIKCRFQMLLVQGMVSPTSGQ